MARDCDDVRRIAANADENGMKPHDQPVPFNPWLGLASKGMWPTSFRRPVVGPTEAETRQTLIPVLRVMAGQLELSSEVPDRTE